MIGRDALAALEPEPDRKQVAEEGAERRRRAPASWPDHQRHEQHRDGALEHVGEQRRGGEALAAGAQHIGGADIAGADRADVLRAGEPREDEAERDRAEQIAEREAPQ